MVACGCADEFGHVGCGDYPDLFGVDSVIVVGKNDDLCPMGLTILQWPERNAAMNWRMVKTASLRSRSIVSVSSGSPRNVAWAIGPS